MKKYSEFLIESIQKLNDENIDNAIKDYFNGKAITFKYDTRASFELGKVCNKVLITSDKEFMHISADINDEIKAVIKKFKLKEVK